MVAQKSFISVEFVRSALEALVHINRETLPNPLCYLALVDELISGPEFPHVEHGREYALEMLLTDIIAETFTHYRNLHGLQDMSAEVPLAEALQAIQQTLDIGATGFMAWTYLYFRYVRSDLDIANETFCGLFCIDARTLRRHHQRVLRQLTDVLTSREWDTRTRLWRQQLYNRLPSSRAIHLWGRDLEFGRVHQMVTTDHYTPPLFVTGVAGIGKTVFVQEYLRSLIDDQRVSCLIWIHQPQSVQHIRASIKDELLAADSNLTMRDYLAQFHTAVVLDAVEDILTTDPDGLVDLFGDLGQALVFLTSRVYVPLAANLSHLPLQELKRSDIIHLIEDMLITRYKESENADLLQLAPTIADSVGGNPRVAQLVLHNIDSLNAVQDGLAQVFDYIYDNLSRVEQAAWFAFTLIPPDQIITIDEITAIWASDIHQDAVFALSRRALIVPAHFPEPAFRLASSSQRYLEIRYKQDDDTKYMVDALVVRLVDYVVCNIVSGLMIAEGLLMSGWIAMPDSLTITLVQRFWREGLYQGHATRWQQIIERLYKQQNLNMKHLPYIYAVTLRHVSEINAARLLLSQFISQMGQVGDFVQQGWALLESAIILRSQGSYETALSHIDRARGIGINWRSPELARAADMERSQILLDVGKAAEMYAVLESIPRTNRVIFLEIEGYLSLNMPERALSLLVDNFALFMHSPDEKVSAHMLLGRCYDRLGRLEEARYHFQVALILLEKAESGRLLGRAQANMGALLIKLREYSEAYRLLRQAEALQKQTEDRVTIAAIQHNFRILNSRTAN